MNGRDEQVAARQAHALFANLVQANPHGHALFCAAGISCRTTGAACKHNGGRFHSSFRAAFKRNSGILTAPFRPAWSTHIHDPRHAPELIAHATLSYRSHARAAPSASIILLVYNASARCWLWMGSDRI